MGEVKTVSVESVVGEVTACGTEMLGAGVPAVSDDGDEPAHAETMNAVVTAKTGRCRFVGIAVVDAGSIRW
jgi:hypothetical protein